MAMSGMADDAFTGAGSSKRPKSSRLPPCTCCQEPETTDHVGPENPTTESHQSGQGTCEHCLTSTLKVVTDISTSLRRIETLLTRTVDALSLDVDLDDLDESMDDKSITRPKRQDIPLLPACPVDDEYDPGPPSRADEFWNVMGPGAEYNRMDRLRDEFVHFFSDDNGRLLRKDCERVRRFPPRYINGALVRDDGHGAHTNEEIIDLMKRECWPRSEGVDRLFGSRDKLQDRVGGETSVHVQFIGCDDKGFVEYAYGDDASSIFCIVTYGGLRTPTSTFNAMAVIMSCMTPVKHRHRIGETPRPVLEAVKQFLECWPSRALTTARFELGTFYSRGYVVLAFSLRSFSKRHPRWEENSVLRPCKVEGTLTGSVVLDEERWCLVLYTTVFRLSGVEPLFSLLALSDNDYSKDPRAFDSAKRWPQLHLSTAVCHTGITAFQWLIIESLIEWSGKWESFLDLLDENSESQTGDVLSAQGRRVAMFDNESFDKSESYFATSQLLRIASGWIKHTATDLDALIEAYHEGYDGEYIKFLNEWKVQDKAERRQLKTVKENWKCVRSFLAVRSKYLLERIQRKEVEIDSLRNGLFNATSVAEAQKSSQLSHYILVFTVITIFYLPLSFITGCAYFLSPIIQMSLDRLGLNRFSLGFRALSNSLFALNMFDFQEPSTKAAFITTSATVGILTYLISFGLAWFVRKEERREMLKSLFPLPLPEFNSFRAGTLGSQLPGKEPPQGRKEIDGGGQMVVGQKREKEKGKGKGREQNRHQDDGDEQAAKGQGPCTSASVLRERFQKEVDYVRSKFGKVRKKKDTSTEWDENKNDQGDIEMGAWVENADDINEAAVEVW